MFLSTTVFIPVKLSGPGVDVDHLAAMKQRSKVNVVLMVLVSGGMR